LKGWRTTVLGRLAQNPAAQEDSAGYIV